jgi:hypothetical protein
MFENLNNQGAERVDDIFADSDKTEEGQSFSAAKNNIPFSKAMPNVDLPGIKQQVDQISSREKVELPDFDDDTKPHPGGKIIKKMLVVILVLAIIGLLAYIVYAKILLPKALNTNNEDLNKNVSLDLGPDVKVDTGSNEETASTTDSLDGDNLGENNVVATGTEETIDPLKKMDSDYDLVSDFDELYVYGSDPYNPDTDNDGLSDFDEVFIFGTNPLKNDSDGDTYLDAAEISSGYSPLSATKKLELTDIKDVSLFSEKYPAIYQKLIQ